MKIEEAASTLNKWKWRGKDDWFVWDAREVVSRSLFDGDKGFASIYAEDAIAIATCLEMRVAVNELRRYVVKRGNENESRARAAYGPDASWYSAKTATYRSIESRLDEVLAQFGEEEK